MPVYVSMFGKPIAPRGSMAVLAQTRSWLSFIDCLRLRNARNRSMLDEGRIRHDGGERVC